MKIKINIEILAVKQNVSNGFNKINRYKKILTALRLKIKIIEIIVDIAVFNKITMSLIRQTIHPIFFQIAYHLLL
jgi:hypothetical protein